MSTDLTAEQVIAMCAPKSDRLNAEDLLHGPIVVRIRGIKGVESDDGKSPMDIYFEGRKLPWKPNVTMRRILSLIWGADPRPWIGRWVRLYRDPEVKMKGIRVGGVRISNLSNMDRPVDVALTETRGQRAMFHIDPLPPSLIPASSAVSVPTWATEGETPLTDEQLGEVVAFLAERKTPIEKVETAMGARDTWTAATVRGIYGRFQAAGSK